MKKETNIHWGWLKFMYFYTLVGAGGLGLAILLIPDRIQSFLSLPDEDPIMFGITGSVYLAFALMACLGLREPLRFAPILLLQFGYKLIWFTGVILPLLLKGVLPVYAIPMMVIFATYILGDLVAIPFSQVFNKQK